jgi:hypothetical protein
MMNFIREAGWGIYPVLAFGVAGLVVAAQQLKGHDAKRTVTVLWLMALTTMAGVLGTATGMQASSRFIHETPKKWIWLVGLQESLNNMVAAGVLVVLAMLVMLAAHVRAPRAMAPA